MPRKAKKEPAGRKKTPVGFGEGPTPEERVAAIEARAAARGWRSMTIEEFNEFLDEFRDIWPDPAEIDEFIAWLYKTRREGRNS